MGIEKRGLQALAGGHAWITFMFDKTFLGERLTELAGIPSLGMQTDLFLTFLPSLPAWKHSSVTSWALTTRGKFSLRAKNRPFQTWEWHYFHLLFLRFWQFSGGIHTAIASVLVLISSIIMSFSCPRDLIYIRLWANMQWLSQRLKFVFVKSS